MKTLTLVILIISFSSGLNSLYAQCIPMELDVTSYSVCIGGEVTLDATAESGADIIWDGGIFDDIVFTPLEIGVFTYTATTLDESDCPLSVDIEVLSLPTVVPGAGDENFCEDEAIVLSAAGDADEYSWDPLDLDPGVGTHTYTLTGTIIGGCESSETLEITVHALPEIIPSVIPDLTCLGQDVVFSVSGAETYVWEDPEIETGEDYTTTIPGVTTYIVSGTDINGCTGIGSVELEVADAIMITGTASDEVAGDDGSIAITISGGVPAYMVDWDNDGTGDFDDPASIAGLSGGTYAVVVQGSMGCEGTATFTVNSQLAVETLEMSAINIYPNPTTNAVSIELAGAFTYEVANSNGQIVYAGNGINKEMVDLADLASGIYYFTIKSELEKTSIRVVKK